jgi:hypothetical protein
MTDYLKNVLRTQYTIHIIILGIMFIAVSIFTHKEFFTYLSFICLFTGFDCIGFGNQINRAQQWNNLDVLVPYRVMQNMFMFMTFFAVCFYTGWLCLLACIIGWWCGGCDVLFYIVLKEKFQDYDYYWMKGWSVWLIVTPIKKFFYLDEYVGRIEFIIICSLGLIAGGLISWIL